RIEACLKTQKFDAEGGMNKALTELDGVINRKTPRYECYVKVEEKSHETEDYNYFPYQFRGRVYLLMAHLDASSRPEKIEDLQKAQSDLSISGKVYRCPSSRAYLTEVERELAALEAAQRWQDDWSALREKISLQQWDSSDASLFAQAGQLLSKASQVADAADLSDALAWIGQQAETAKGKADDIGKKASGTEADRNAAARLSRWCAFMIPLADYEPLRTLAPSLKEIRESLAPHETYRGQMNLRVWVWRAGRIEKLSIDGKEIPLSRQETPLVLKEPLNIGRLVIVTSENPAKPVRIELDAGQFKDGGSYLLTIDPSSESHRLTLLSPK
ncbi:MAG TPA: hypothetical protein VKU80_05980, partial [Planctomycetota bacterium]|nr:hypothetical protein [Planctomycetota bacterium]